ncbi:MAG: geranylgeranyl reductase family protein [Oscillatoria sp. PMC 1068.18]|nr:geranylgeranyl reductase family protein [Oscillatoria sp. PMC 1076.18]MEC4990301.1 geranylgeranyl reductase family protein [Oscillatoria sp. PMC 1068.18]
MKTDVAIIGAGPSGGMAACRLAKTGLNIKILEKAILPRHKPCGGGIPVGILKTLDWDITPFVEREVLAIKNLYNYTLPKLESRKEASILMVNRSRFDYHLVERALELGNGRVDLQDGFEVSCVEEGENEVVVQGKNGDKIEANLVIAADGVFSKTAQYLGLNKGRKVCAAIDAEVEVIPEVYELEKDYATFNFFCLANGYGWIFPKDGILSCGVGAWDGKVGLVKELQDFLSKSFPSGSIRSVKRFGYQIPIYSGDRAIASRRVCLVGDAASLVDPILGEGIRFAIRSGIVAAEVVAGLLQAETGYSHDYEISPWGKGDCGIYQSLIHQTLGKNFNALRLFAGQLFLQAPELFYRKFILEGQNYGSLSYQMAEKLNSFSTVK